MLTNGKQVSFFAGAGIVNQSVPEAEWEEISDKILATAGIFPKQKAQ